MGTNLVERELAFVEEVDKVGQGDTKLGCAMPRASLRVNVVGDYSPKWTVPICMARRGPELVDSQPELEPRFIGNE